MRKFNTFVMAVVCFFATATSATAQDSPAEESDNNLFNHLAVGLNMGTPGIGIDLSAPITPYAAIRAGFNFFPKFKYHDDFYLSDTYIDEYNKFRRLHPEENLPDPTWSDGDVAYEASAHNTTGHVLFDFYPGKKCTFHFTVGAYFGPSYVVKLKNTKEGLFKGVSVYNQYAENHSAEGYQKIGVWFDDTYFLEPDADGNVNGNIKVSGFRPYLGIGVGRAVPRHRMGFQCDLGVQFWGKPKVYCQGQEISKTEGNDHETDDGGFVKTVKKITVYPTLNFRLVGRIL
ncbi:MAG: hypothetical protein PUD15_08330 [Prevotella sp.]|nr:hypothetical protein [Prevotella sp.]